MCDQMTSYYYELDHEKGEGKVFANSDVAAKQLVTSKAKAKAKDAKVKDIKILVIYKESDTPDGLPFIEIYP